jgi:hypothetical protein
MLAWMWTRLEALTISCGIDDRRTDDEQGSTRSSGHGSGGVRTRRVWLERRWIE